MVMVLGSTVAGSWGSICGVASLAVTTARGTDGSLTSFPSSPNVGLVSNVTRAMPSGPRRRSNMMGDKATGQSWALAGV